MGVGVGGGNTDVLRYKVAKLEEERATLVAKVRAHTYTHTRMY